MNPSMPTNDFIASLPRIFTRDHLVYMKNGKVYRVYRQDSDYGVYKYMRGQGFNTKDIVKIEIVSTKKA